MPPYLSHLLQPLNVGCFSPLKKAYGRQAENLMRNKINVFHHRVGHIIAWVTSSRGSVFLGATNLRYDSSISLLLNKEATYVVLASNLKYI